MIGVEFMAKQNQINYVKPNMTSLHGKLGRDILNTIMNTPRPDLSELTRQSNEVESRILAARKAKSNGK